MRNVAKEFCRNCPRLWFCARVYTDGREGTCLAFPPFEQNVSCAKHEIADLIAMTNLTDMKEVNPMRTNLQIHNDLCAELHKIYVAKNHDYGDSFHTTFVEEGFAMSRIRLSDKLNRFKTLTRGERQDVKDESVRDTLLDLANYALMTVLEIEREKTKEP